MEWTTTATAPPTKTTFVLVARAEAQVRAALVAPARAALVAPAPALVAPALRVREGAERGRLWTRAMRLVLERQVLERQVRATTTAVMPTVVRVGP